MAQLTDVLNATAIVLDGETRVGSAVLVDGRHLLTADHVVSHLRGGDRALRNQLRVHFPAVHVPGAAFAVSPATFGDPMRPDVAVLHLNGRPTGLPLPVSVSAKRTLPTTVQVLGFPIDERGTFAGVWRKFRVSRAVAHGRVQLDWMTDVGTLPGHSGGPVIDPDSGELVGVLVEGSERGRFDRFVPVSVIADHWPGLARPWLFAGQDSRDHFTARARGHRSAGRGGDLFRGRSRALATVRDWLTRSDPPGFALVVTGQPGAGKSSLLARAALLADAERINPGHLFMPARPPTQSSCKL